MIEPCEYETQATLGRLHDETGGQTMGHKFTGRRPAQVTAKRLTELIDRFGGHLLPRERAVLTLRSGDEVMSLRCIGKVLLVSKERVRQIQNRAIDKLLRAEGDEQK